MTLFNVDNLSYRIVVFDRLTNTDLIVTYPPYKDSFIQLGDEVTVKFKVAIQ